MQECRSNDVFCVASEISDAFCFICLTNLTDVATNNDRTTSHSGKAFLFFFSVVVPLTKGLDLLRFVVYLKFFFEACPFRSLQWFLGATSCAEQFCRVHTFYISVLGGMCTASDHQKLAIPP